MNQLSRYVVASLVLSALLLNVPSVFGQSTDPATWQSDVEVLMDSLRKIHPGLYHAHSKEEWKQAAARLKRRLPSLSYAEAVMGFSRLVSLAEDGHTRILLPQKQIQKIYPVGLYLFSDGLYVYKASDKYTDLFGERITKINGMSVQEVFDRLRPYIPASSRLLRIRISAGREISVLSLQDCT